MKFSSFWKKPRKVKQIQRKNSCCVVGAHTKEVSPKIRQSSSILWNCSIFVVINQSDRPKSRKELYKTFSINGLFWWNFICTTKMISRVYITWYMPNSYKNHLIKDFFVYSFTTLGIHIYKTLRFSNLVLNNTNGVRA